jgi:hypothetical protein
MTKAFIETTVLTDYLLKRDDSEKAAAAAIADFDRPVVPQFAWKEFKRGPLKNFAWAHNKLGDTRSFLATLAALQRMSRTPRRYITSTAIQALHTAFTRLFDSSTLDDLRRTYTAKADTDAIHADALRYELKRVIIRSWNKRTKLFGGPYHILSCYPDAPITADVNRLEVEPVDCPRTDECCIKPALRKRGNDLSALRSAISGEKSRKEVRDRMAVLRQLEKHFTSLMGRKECRAFGDAYFVMFCPAGAVVLTTNERDIMPMASALGVAARLVE